MATPFLGEVKVISFNFAPKGWAFCNGQLLALNQNQALFSLLGTTYGGNGRTTFGLPNLQGRAPLHRGQGIPHGQSYGNETETLLISEIPAHTHQISGSSHAANQRSARGNTFGNNAALPGESHFAALTNPVALDPASLPAFPGGGQPHPNMQPYLVLNFIIALQGIFPSRN